MIMTCILSLGEVLLGLAYALIVPIELANAVWRKQVPTTISTLCMGLVFHLVFMNDLIL